MLTKIASLYKDNDPEVFSKVYLNEITGYYEVHYYDETIKEEPPVGLFTKYLQAIESAREWTI
jgi:hypothetical protein